MSIYVYEQCGDAPKITSMDFQQRKKKTQILSLKREETNTGNPYDNAQHVDLHPTSCKFKKWDQTRDQLIIVQHLQIIFDDNFWGY